ncbi:MFS general substrate transporter [Xylariaceae sp. FL0255]|nr:MFS general substrate transporter [Xylariaceae sp. FL0255]
MASSHGGNDQDASSNEKEYNGHLENDFHNSTTCVDDDDEHDGHRPRDLDLSRTRTTSWVSAVQPAQTPLGATLSRRETALSRIRSRPFVPQFSHPLGQMKTGDDVIVDFEGPDDPYRSVNWPTKKKVFTTLIYGLVTGSSTWASSSLSPGNKQIAEQYHVSQEVALLSTSLFLVGFGVGPLLWAPLSEVYGRRTAVLPPVFISLIFSFATASATNLQTILITRFFAAFFASAPVTNTGGVLGDLFTPAYRGIAFAGYAMAVVGGPALGPIISSTLIAQPRLGWRWAEYLTGFIQVFVLALAVIFVDETYPPALLVAKARRLRVETGNWALHAKFEEWDVSISELTRKFLVRPIQLLCTPICFLVALYASFCYGILYMQLAAVPTIFGEHRGFGIIDSELPFLAIFLGAVVGAGINVYNQFIYNKAYEAAGNRALPEKRLPPMMVGSLMFAGGQFITAWTADPLHIHWIVPVIGLFFTGTGFFTIFQAALNYLVDTFTMYAASAIAANTFLRSLFATVFPLLVTPVYGKLGIGPGASIFAGFSVLLIPVPYAFYIYGRRIRAASKWSKPSVI